MLEAVLPEFPEVPPELLDGGRLEEVADGVPEGDRVPVLGRDPHIEVDVGQPEGGVEAACIKMKMEIKFNTAIKNRICPKN